MGYEQTILSQISQLRDVLQRHHGFAVVRELIQNADDAGAARLDIGCVGPLAGADHPLLEGGPALFVINDGPFSHDNARSIKQLGLSDKAGDAGTIGKFGLGLKSIHHFGEVYFYLSSAGVRLWRLSATPSATAPASTSRSSPSSSPAST